MRVSDFCIDFLNESSLKNEINRIDLIFLRRLGRERKVHWKKFCLFSFSIEIEEEEEKKTNSSFFDDLNNQSESKVREEDRSTIDIYPVFNKVFLDFRH